jgi:hypothetical protein
MLGHNVVAAFGRCIGSVNIVIFEDLGTETGLQTALTQLLGNTYAIGPEKKQHFN